MALLFLPARAQPSGDVDRLVEGASTRLPDDPERRLGLARAALELLAEAGMSSLTYNAVAARSGIGTTTLERLWTSRVDAVSDALAEIFAAHPVPDTGDLRTDLRSYLQDVGDVLGTEGARRPSARSSSRPAPIRSAGGPARPGRGPPATAAGRPPGRRPITWPCRSTPRSTS